MNQLTDIPKRFLRTMIKVEPHEMKAVILSFLYAILIFASYNMIKPYRDAMGTVYGAKNLPSLFTGTFLAMLAASSIYGAFASRIKLATFLPWVWGFLIINILAFLVLFKTVGSTRALAAVLIPIIGLNNLLVCSAVLLFGALLLVRSLEKEKCKVARFEPMAARTVLDHKLGGNPFAGFTHLFRSPYLLMISAFIMLMTWVSTIAYIQQTQLIANAYTSVPQRAQVLATIETIVNTAAFILAILGTGRITQRFGLTATLLVNPVFMVIGFFALALSPVIDTVVYRLGDVSASYAAAPMLAPFGIPGTAAFGAVVCLVWACVAVLLGRRYDDARAEHPGNAPLAEG